MWEKKISLHVWRERIGIKLFLLNEIQLDTKEKKSPYVEFFLMELAFP